MPKTKVERIVSDDGVTRTIEVEVSERGVTKTARYEVPSTPEAWQDFVLSLDDDTRKNAEGEDTGETMRAWGYRMWVSSIDRVARGTVYKSVAAESTTIIVGGEKRDVLDFALPKLVKAINGYRTLVDMRVSAGSDQATAEKAVSYGPWKVAARKLVEQGKARDVDNVLTAT